MMIKVDNFYMTPEQYSYFVEQGALDCRIPFAIEVTREEWEMLESKIEKVEKSDLSWLGIPVYIKER